jgi:hypothetical protein
MSGSISSALALIDDRLEGLHELLTDEPVDVVTERYRAWKSGTIVALADIVVESALTRFNLARGEVDRGDGRRPTPPVFLDGAASRAFLMALKKDLAKEPAAVLRLPPREAMSAHELHIRTIVDLLERRLPRAFRGRPEKDREVQNGFETLLAGAGIAYEREHDSIVYASKTYVPDFTFPGLQAALEVKLCDRPDRETEILAEINEEIPAYRTRYSNLIFGVYDLGFIQATDRFSRSFDESDGVLVRVMKQP